MTDIVDELDRFEYPAHITQDQKDTHRLAKYKHHTLGLQINMYEDAMNIVVKTSEGLKPLELPPLSV